MGVLMPGMMPSHFHSMSPSLHSPLHPRPLFQASLYDPHQTSSPIQVLSSRGSFNEPPRPREHDNQLPSPSFPPQSPTPSNDTAITATLPETELPAGQGAEQQNKSENPPLAAPTGVEEAPKPPTQEPNPAANTAGDARVPRAAAPEVPQAEPTAEQNTPEQEAAAEPEKKTAEPAQPAQELPEPSQQEEAPTSSDKKGTPQEAISTPEAPTQENGTDADKPSPVSVSSRTLAVARQRGVKMQAFAKPKQAPKSIYDGGLYWKTLVRMN